MCLIEPIAKLLFMKEHEAELTTLDLSGLHNLGNICYLNANSTMSKNCARVTRNFESFFKVIGWNLHLLIIYLYLRQQRH